MAKNVKEEVLVRPPLKSKFDKIKPVWRTKQKTLTFPNRTLTLRQISDRFANGLSAIDEKVALYDDGKVVIKNFEKLDLTERMEIVRDAEERMRMIIHERQTQAKAKKDQEFAMLVQKRVDDEIAKREREKPGSAFTNQ